MPRLSERRKGPRARAALVSTHTARVARRSGEKEVQMVAPSAATGTRVNTGDYILILFMLYPRFGSSF